MAKRRVIFHTPLVVRGAQLIGICCFSVIRVTNAAAPPHLIDGSLIVPSINGAITGSFLPLIVFTPAGDAAVYNHAEAMETDGNKTLMSVPYMRYVTRVSASRRAVKGIVKGRASRGSER
ncbi:hypothetical protein AAFF_G00412620 [Aldrovandia affinis]|uniref:Uncharacterized protein n=1 Tax=Aldrovandia affinis TaxID=143900 RepID=A0AAD7WKD1_9TELE|nr:hypothetical protein AAFF_G00412620 [Aldrovandia affinis]